MNQLPTEMICLCGHDFLQHPIANKWPHLWKCIASDCDCQEWADEVDFPSPNISVDIRVGV